MGNPSARSACGRNSRAFLATRKVLVATARTADGCSPVRRSRKRARHSSAAFIADDADPSLGIESGAKTQGLAPGIEAVDLVAFDAADFETETVRAQIDDGKQMWRARWTRASCDEA